MNKFTDFDEYQLAKYNKTPKVNNNIKPEVKTFGWDRTEGPTPFTGLADTQQVSVRP